MLAPLSNRTYRHLFLAQVGSLLGTGLATVALGLLAYELAGAEAGVVLGTALAIKMIAYVGIAPVVGAYAASLPRRPFLVALDLVRALVGLSLPFVDQIWQVYVLIFVLQACSAAFTPTFQATIPDVLPDERTYTQALSLSRLAYDLESLVSPALAALLLTVISFHWLFAGTAIGFLASALLVVSVTLPGALAKPSTGGVLDRTTLGVRRYLATPRLRGLLALNLAAAAGGAMVIVNTVVVVRAGLGGGDTDVALALAVFGGGSMAAAFTLPRLLDHVSDRSVMLAGGAGLVVVLALFGLMAAGSTALWWPFHVAWLCLGLCYSTVLTPGGRLLRRSSDEAGRPALFAAQFALSHACWLLTYPLSGWLGATVGLAATLLALALVALAGLAIAFAVWPADDRETLPHMHDDLPDGHPHLAAHAGLGKQHAHAYVIDDLHRRWPRAG